MSALLNTAFRRLGKGSVAAVGLVLTVLGLLGFSALGADKPAGGPSQIALQLAFSEDAFGRIVAQWGAEGVRTYRDVTLGLDYLFPIAYALCLSGAIAWLTRARGRDPTRLELALFAMPWVAALLDWVENTLHLLLLGDLTRISAAPVLLASLAAAAKWCLMLLSALTILYSLLHRPRATRPVS